MTDYLPKFEAGAAASITTSADVIGGRVVIASGVNTCAHAGADAENTIGVAGRDATSGDKVIVHLRPGGIHRLTASGAITAGAKVATAAAGKVQTIASLNNPIGVALQTSVNDGDVIDVLFL